jgi:hypothetical protein
LISFEELQDEGIWYIDMHRQGRSYGNFQEKGKE